MLHGGRLLCNMLPLRFQLRNLYLVSCGAYMTRLQLTHIKRPLFSVFLLIVEVDIQIKSCISHLKNANLKIPITFTKMEKYVSQPT